MAAVNTAADVAHAVLKCLECVEGLRPSVPAALPTTSLIPWDWDMLAVDVGPDSVQVHVVATRLPLPALLQQAGDTIRDALAGTGWSAAQVRIVVTDVDRGTFHPGP